MEKEKIYQEIRNLSRKLQKDAAVYTRADVAYELRGFGVEKDSFEVERLVWEAYKHFNEDAAIGQAFYDNGKKRPLVAGWRRGAADRSRKRGLAKNSRLVVGLGPFAGHARKVP